MQELDIKTEYRSWVEIDLARLKGNLDIYAGAAGGREIMAVVKADAYGHGDQRIASFLWENGIKRFAVSNIDEAIHIRQAGVGGQILILGYTPVSMAPRLVEYDLTQTLLGEDYAARLSGTGVPVRCQFALDTGMRRIGLNADDPDECERVIRKYASRLRLEGLFTHLCVADTPAQDAFTKRQIALFEDVVRRVSDLGLADCHCLNSAGGLAYGKNAPGLIRLGIVLYGLKPDIDNTLPPGVEPALSWKSVVSMVKTIRPGDTVGYGRTFTAQRTMKIATIPTGYADGYPRLLSNRGAVLINGRRAPIAGRICMDQMMADVTDIPGVDYESEVVLMGRSGEEIITADDIASLCGTIGYEVICGINKRVRRVYRD